MSGHALHRRLVPAVPAGAFVQARSAARAVAFWLAVALPLAYLPVVLLAPAVLDDPSLLVGAVTANLAAIVVGHGYEPRR
ncbi:MAG: hypothetical protein U5J98_02590 [Halobacteriales archaeon]|nr:hypothetical protein [Halobacteriales archaeon]